MGLNWFDNKQQLIKGLLPNTKHFLGYDPTTNTTKYMTPQDTTYLGGSNINIEGTTKLIPRLGSMSINVDGLGEVR